MQGAASTIPAALRDAVVGTLPIGTELPGFGVIERTSLTAYFVRPALGVGAWLPFVHVHGARTVEPLVVFG